MHEFIEGGGAGLKGASEAYPQGRNALRQVPAARCTCCSKAAARQHGPFQPGYRVQLHTCRMGPSTSLIRGELTHRRARRRRHADGSLRRDPSDSQGAKVASLPAKPASSIAARGTNNDGCSSVSASSPLPTLPAACAQLVRLRLLFGLGLQELGQQLLHVPPHHIPCQLAVLVKVSAHAAAQRHAGRVGRALGRRGRAPASGWGRRGLSTAKHTRQARAALPGAPAPPHPQRSTHLGATRRLYVSSKRGSLEETAKAGGPPGRPLVTAMASASNMATTAVVQGVAGWDGVGAGTSSLPAGLHGCHLCVVCPTAWPPPHPTHPTYPARPKTRPPHPS